MSNRRDKKIEALRDAWKQTGELLTKDPEPLHRLVGTVSLLQLPTPGGLSVFLSPIRQRGHDTTVWTDDPRQPKPIAANRVERTIDVGTRLGDLAMQTNFCGMHYDMPVELSLRYSPRHGAQLFQDHIEHRKVLPTFAAEVGVVREFVDRINYGELILQQRA